MSENVSVPELYQQIVSLLEEASHNLQMEPDLELAPLEQAIKIFGQTLSSMPISEMLKYGQELTDLSEKLRMFETALLSRKEAIKQELGGLNQQARGIGSYLNQKKHEGA